jgi:hypothetical protein
MGALIQTKGTQRLARHFNDRFDNNSMNATRGVSNASRTLRNAFADGSLDLLAISDMFIAQNAGSGWPSDGNDFLYPSATMTTTSAGPGSTLQFRLPSGVTAIPDMILQGGAPICSLDTRKIRGAFGGVPTLGAGGNFSVPVVDKPGGTTSVTIPFAANERISFAKGRHERLVRRWRWYLQHDLTPENHAAIRRAISAALEDTDFKKITFQSVEDTQRVLAKPERQLTTNFEFDDAFIMHIILMTQQTTAPDPLDPQ